MVAQPTIIAYQWQTYKDQTIRVDGIQFIDCTFEHCELEFAGEALPLFQRCKLVDVSWNLVGHAAATIQFLEMLDNAFGEGGKQFVNLVFEVIRHRNELVHRQRELGESTLPGRRPDLYKLMKTDDSFDAGVVESGQEVSEEHRDINKARGSSLKHLLQQRLDGLYEEIANVKEELRALRESDETTNEKHRA
jgi:hypothetical protein